ncbi:DUF2235 domain-containing protein [Pontixanthobacter aestiaquae]|uniref:DUF2235 domain-containing protein n=1 Tax=Pontixanthobacter aestiaquae TaxID=1509367 RepID=A0A844Z7J7_9SPHN|nr:DUF2235 domain-containing protein [Pontixanthobacter aestiaquae]MDN3645115.1 DUF2235 domain-containing protein [Pontixanthobacter aestiaquae]MXO83885.1 DUF2235 domain-containing protein [Pontixanthobacter aestiaquae]
MSKNILIFSDGTGQIGGLKPDQKLSNVYKMYRAMRPGPDSPISYDKQIAYYDPGLGAGEVEGVSLRKIRNKAEAAIGTGIDENVIDCYEKILEYYKPGDRIFLFGFSRGAYTVRVLANVMNLCGIPTRMPDWSPLPPRGPKLRKIARLAVKSVYGHGAGKPRGQQPFLSQREEKGRRFRNDYGSAPPPSENNVQGNVQPDFIGVFDTVAALGNALLFRLFAATVLVGLVFTYLTHSEGWNAWFVYSLAAFTGLSSIWLARVVSSQIRYFEPDPDNPLSLWKPWDWLAIYRNTHLARWNRQNYDKWLDSDVGFARHALAIDESRADFPRVEWGSSGEVAKNADKEPQWLHQVWFAGCHSDIGGSYPEAESRLSDISLDWMVRELRSCFFSVQLQEHMLHMSPDPKGQQHEERILKKLGPIQLKWKVKPREVHPEHKLHYSVIQRLETDQVRHPEEIKPYRPEQLRNHPDASQYYPSKPVLRK